MSLPATAPALPCDPRRHVRGLSLVTVIALLVGTIACARKDVKSELGRVRSWTAASKLATELHGVGATNDAVTNQLLRRASESHAKEGQQLSALAKSDSQRAAARGLLDSLQRTILELQREAR